MADIQTVLSRMNNANLFQTIARNPLAQFGTRARPYLGPTLLPNRLVAENMFQEEFLHWRAVMANDGTRYSPTQLKGGSVSGSMNVQLFESDKASELTSRDYDALLRLIGQGDDVMAMAQITDFVNTTVNVPLEELLEKQRWQAIVGASVSRVGDNGYAETVAFTNPSGNRFAQSAAWSTNSTDPYTDITTAINAAAAKGLKISRVITSTTVLNIMANNAKIQSRAGRVTVNVGTGGVQLAAGRASFDQINQAFSQDQIPPIELYDLQYRTETGSARFLPSTVMVLIAETGRDASLDLGDTTVLAPELLDRLGNTVGYTAIGRPAGQRNPGRVVQAKFNDLKPQGVFAEGWQTAAPVVTVPDAIYVITGIS